MNTQQPIRLFRSSADAYWCVALSPDGKRVAAGTGESSVVLWDTATGNEVAHFNLGEPLLPVEGQLRFGPDSRSLILSGPRTWLWRAMGFSDHQLMLRR